MVKCIKCNYDFQNTDRLKRHEEKYPNCINRCLICLKYFATAATLRRHSSVNCKQKFECEKCLKHYTTKFRQKNHKCIPIIEEEQTDQKDIVIVNDKNKPNQLEQIQQILENYPNRNIVINNNNYYGNKIDNVEIKDNKIQNVQNVQNNQINQVNFLKTTPRNFNFDYNVSEELKQRIPEFIKMDGYEEEIADKFMYETEEYEKLPDDIKNKYESKLVSTKGMIEFFKELQKDEKNRNVIIQKSKSGKCYVFEFTKWKEKDLKDYIPNIYKKVCNAMHDLESSLNHYLHEIIQEKPKKFIELKKAIEKEIWKLSKIKYELDQINKLET